MAKQAKPVKKLPAVKEAVKKLGVNAPVGEIRKYIKEKYNLDLTDSVAHNYTTKARQAVRNGTPNSPPARRGRPPASASAAITMAAPTHPHTKVDDVVDAITALKGMTSTLGKTNVERLLKAL